MSPTYADGAVLWTKPVDRPLRRGDVVIADTPEGRVIKRVALLPGDRRLQWKAPCGGAVDLVGLRPPDSRVGWTRIQSLPVPPGSVFLLGDDLNGSLDSRSFGPIPLDQVRRLVVDQRAADARSGLARPFARAWIEEGSRVALLKEPGAYPTNL